MSTSKNKKIYSERKASKEEALAFIRKSIISKGAFFKGVDLNAKLEERGSAIKIVTKTELKEGDLIDFFVGEEHILLPIQKRNEILFSGKVDIKESPEYRYPYFSILEIDKTEFKVISVTKEKIFFEVLPDNFEFILKSVNSELDIKINDITLNSKITIDNSKKHKILAICNINKDLNEKNFKKYNDFIESIRKNNKITVIKDIFKSLDDNLAVL